MVYIALNFIFDILNNKVKILLHILFWVIVILAISPPVHYGDNQLPGTFFLKEAIDIAFYAFIIYFNLYYLFPKYLKGNSLSIYVVYLVFTVLLLTPIKGAVLYLVQSNNYQFKSQIIRNLHYTFLSTFFIAGASTVFKILIEWVVFQREKKKYENEKMRSELKFLRSQINPHFLFNTLNNVYALSLVNSEKTPDVILKLSDILRYMLYECNVPKVKLESEIKYIRNYIELERLRQSKNVVIDFDLEGECEEKTIAPLLFTPFLENAFKHGLNRTIKGGYIKIKMKIEDDDLWFFVENSKPEMKSELLKNNPGGIGLVNVKKRLNILYKGKYNLDIINTLNVYKIKLYIKLK